jgi:hypothetical protein
MTVKPTLTLLFALAASVAAAPTMAQWISHGRREPKMEDPI